MSVGPLKAITVAAGPTGYTECGHAWPNAEVIKYIFPSVLELTTLGEEAHQEIHGQGF